MTSGARLEPPIPKRTTRRKPALRTSSAKASISGRPVSVRPGASSQPSRDVIWRCSAGSEDQSEASWVQILSSIFFGGQALEQQIVGIREEFHALFLKSGRDGGHVDAQAPECGERFERPRVALFDRRAGAAVVPEGRVRGRGQRVH